MKTLLLVGHLSPFGKAFAHIVLAHPAFSVDALVLANEDRWLYFRRRLQQVERLPNEKHFRKIFRRTSEEFIRNIRHQFKSVEIIWIEDANSSIEKDRASRYDLVLTAAFPQIFSADFIAAPQKGAVNFHPSYLPRCRGAHPVYWTIASREPFGGVSSHFMSTRIDTGPIIARRKIGFDPQTIIYTQLYDSVLKILPEVVNDTAVFFQEESSQAITQNEEEATTFRENLSWHNRIYWETEDEETILAKIRAGGAFTVSHNGWHIRLYPPVRFQREQPSLNQEFKNRLADGLIIEADTENLQIKCRQGFIHSVYRVNHPLVFQKYWGKFLVKVLKQSILKAHDRLL